MPLSKLNLLPSIRMREARFGEYFSIDPNNRLDILSGRHNVPEYVEFGRVIRQRLRESVDEVGWPKVPHDMLSIGDLFESVEQTVSERWTRWVGVPLDARRSEWLKEIPDTEENQLIRNVLSNPDMLEGKMRIRQIGVLEGLRVPHPDIWRTLLIACSERQLASVVLARHWIAELSEEELEKMDITREELMLVTDVAAFTGKFIDNAFIKQVELADTPGGTKKTKFNEEQGAEFIYDMYTSSNTDAVTRKTFTDIFSAEWPPLVRNLYLLSSKTLVMLEQGQLPDTYSKLPEYLRQMAIAYGSSETSPDVLYRMWTDLYKMGTELAESGCPLMLIAQGSQSVAGEANKTDVELRIGIRTSETKELDKKSVRYKRIAQRIVNDHSQVLANPYEVTDAIFNFQPFAFGPNLYWITRGESTEGAIVTHENSDRDIALASEIPLLQTVFEIDGLDEQAYQRAATQGTALHEIAHGVLHRKDKKIDKKLGTSRSTSMLEELKAETVSMVLLEYAIIEGDPSIDFVMDFLAKLGTVCNYIGNKAEESESGRKYYDIGVVIIGRLIKHGVIARRNGKYEITNHRLGIRIIATLGEEIIGLYANESTTPSDVEKYVKELKRQARIQEVQRFISQLQDTSY